MWTQNITKTKGREQSGGKSYGEEVQLRTLSQSCPITGQAVSKFCGLDSPRIRMITYGDCWEMEIIGATIPALYRKWTKPQKTGTERLKFSD